MSTASADGATKPINDRLGNGSGERMLSREEQPVDLRDATRNANGGLVVPLTGGAAVAPYPAASTAGAAAAGRRGHRASRNGSAPSPFMPTPLHRLRRAGGSGAGRSPRGGSPPGCPGAADGRAEPVGCPARADAAIATVRGGRRTTRAPAPARAATPRASEVGGWVVQLSAQKTEGEAQSAFRAAQAKYSVLGSYQPLIRKKDQGDRGVFYAAQVGPLAREEANQLCENLKSAGGSCFIQRN